MNNEQQYQVLITVGCKIGILSSTGTEVELHQQFNEWAVELKTLQLDAECLHKMLSEAVEHAKNEKCSIEHHAQTIIRDHPQGTALISVTYYRIIED